MELTAKKIGIGACIVIFVIGAFLMTNYNGKINEAEAKLADATKKINDAQEIIDEAALLEEGDIGATIGAKVDLNNPDDVAKFNENLKAANEAGALMAKMQNEYQNLSGDQIAKHAEKLDEVLSSNSAPARTPWYVNSTAKCTWTSSEAFVANDGLIPMMWLCKNTDTGELLAYATGTYNTNDGLFYSMDHRITIIGSSYLAQNQAEDGGHSDGPSVDDIQGLMDAITKAGDGVEQTGDLSDISQGREALQQAGKDADEY